MALASRPELILCDLLMPKANGFQVCRSIRQLLHRTKIIVVSGRDYGVDRTSALEAGADEYLVKPIRWENLREVIERVLPPSQDGETQSRPVPEFNPPSTRVKFWGVRGSIPVPGSSTVGYGGNTSCVEVRGDGQIIILDAGTGLRELGISLEEEFGDQPIHPTLLITHFHGDHIQGLPFFRPAYDEKNFPVPVLGYQGAEESIQAVLEDQMNERSFPVKLGAMGAVSIRELTEFEFQIGRVKVEARYAKHPGICVGYRLITSNGSIAFFPDNEPYEVPTIRAGRHEKSDLADARTYAAEERAKLVEFLRHTDILIIDTQYTDEEYAEKVGWGHGSLSSVASLAVDAEVRKLFLFHHDPEHDDRMLDEMVERARMLVLESGQPMEVDAAREGTEVWLGAKASLSA